MPATATDMVPRRAILGGLIAAAGLPRLTWADAGNPAYLAAARDHDGTAWLHGLDRQGGAVFRLPLPGRGHAAAAHPTRPEAVAFARRPGTYALVIDCAAGTALARLSPPPGRQFNGHGIFAEGGDLLLTSEVVAETGDGLLGVWDASRGYSRMDEWPTHGTGPHDVRLLPDGRMAVANGGIRTDPTDRTKLNIETMRPNLAYLAGDGSLAELVELPRDLWRNSIRHLALLPDGGVAFAMQWEGDTAEPVPQLGLHRAGSAPQLCPAPEAEALAMRGYAGSIAVDRGRGLIALTSAPGGVVMLFDLAGAHVGTIRRQDASGVAEAEHGFLVTDGLGVVSACTREGLRPLMRFGTAWDNHLVPAG